MSEAKGNAAVGILCDECIDIANLKQLVVFICFFGEYSIHVFFKMVDVKDGTIDSIEKALALLEVLSKCDIPISRICSFGSDGAAIMMGQQYGVAARLK